MSAFFKKENMGTRILQSLFVTCTVCAVSSNTVYHGFDKTYVEDFDGSDGFLYEKHILECGHDFVTHAHIRVPLSQADFIFSV